MLSNKRNSATTPERVLITLAALAVMSVIAALMLGGPVALAQSDSGAVPNLRLSSATPGELTASWDAPDPAPSDYRIIWAEQGLDFLSYKNSNEANRGNEYPSGEKRSITLTGLTKGETFKVMARARYTNGGQNNGPWSGPWTETMTTRVKDDPPAAPTGLTAPQVAHDSVTLTWTAPSRGTVTGYRVLRGVDTNSLSAIAADTGSTGTEYTDSTVAAETAYHYAVLALSPDGGGAQSTTASATTPAEPDREVGNGSVPNLRLSSASPGKLTISWDAPDPAPSDYRIIWAKESLDFLSYSRSNEADRGNEYPSREKRSITLTGLAKGETFKVKARTRYTSGGPGGKPAGPWAATVTTRVKDDSPAAPTGLTAAQPAHNSVTLTWTAPSRGSVTGYRVLRGTDANSLSAIVEDTGSTGTEYTDTTVAAETAYYYEVLALSPDGDGVQSATASVTTPAAPQPPSAPTGLVATPSHDRVSLSWDDPQNSSITGYRIWRGADADNLTELVSDTGSASTSYTDDTVSAETAYRYAVAAINAHGAGPQFQTGITTLAAPTPIVVPPDGEGQDAVAENEILVLVEAPPWTLFGSEQTVTVEVRGLDALGGISDFTGVDYTYRVDVVDSDGNDADGCEGGGMGAAIRFYADRFEWMLVRTGSSELLEASVSADCALGSYSVSVRVFDDDGAQVASTSEGFEVKEEPPTVLTEVTPDTPAGLTGALQDDESVELDWYDAPNAASYQFSYRHAHDSVWTELPAGDASLTVTGSSAVVSGLPYPLNYYLRVRAANAEGTSDWSDELLVTPAPMVGTDGCVVTAPPDRLAQYDKYCSAGGIDVVGSDEVSDFAIKLAWNHIMNMLSAHPGAHARMAQANVRHVLKAATTPGSTATYSNALRRAKTDEENLLCYPGEIRRRLGLYDTFNHEFGHALQRQGLTQSEFDETVRAYEAAMEEGLWQGRYGSSNEREYFADAVEAYFSPRTTWSRFNRQSLAEYDPRLYGLLLKYLPVNDWRAQCPSPEDAPPPPPAPPVPTGLQISNVTRTSVTLTWNVPADEAANVDLFSVKQATDSGNGWFGALQTTGTVTTATITDLLPGKAYSFRITAVNGYRETYGSDLSVTALTSP